eukprot:gb/GECG01011571.1/.p1 GENE.gb/GECG01011571.1/~~gb/GECG01011571.1/.p1  ORF type:complete len:221 (+),score=17.69 gb/GECG01011571.1/:1-663(+)
MASILRNNTNIILHRTLRQSTGVYHKYNFVAAAAGVTWLATTTAAAARLQSLGENSVCSAWSFNTMASSSEGGGYTYKFPRPAVTVDALIFAFEQDNLYLLMIQRGKDPFEGKWALPGGFVDPHEDLRDAALRELQEETHLKVPKVKQVGAFGKPGRDPRGHTISVAYYTVVDNRGAVKGDDDASAAQWHNVKDLPGVAFDHDELIATSLRQLIKVRSFS